VFLSNFVIAQTQKAVPIDKAIAEDAGEAILSELEDASRVVILRQSSYVPEIFFNYVESKLTSKLIENKKLIVVERKNTELLLSERNTQLNLDVYNPDTTVGAGNFWGAQYIVIISSLEMMNKDYNFMIRLVNADTAKIELEKSLLVTKRSVTQFIPQTTHKATNKEITRTIENKFAVGTLNLGMGLGSYLNGDLKGGVLISTGYAIGIGLMIWEVTGLKYEDAAAGVPGTIGLGVTAITAVFGFIRPYLYQRIPVIANILNETTIAIIPNNTGIKEVRVSYRLSY
jgi:hypothetical protein